MASSSFEADGRVRGGRSGGKSLARLVLREGICNGTVLVFTSFEALRKGCARCRVTVAAGFKLVLAVSNCAATGDAMMLYTHPCLDHSSSGCCQPARGHHRHSRQHRRANLLLQTLASYSPHRHAPPSAWVALDNTTTIRTLTCLPRDCHTELEHDKRDVRISLLPFVSRDK